MYYSPPKKNIWGHSLHNMNPQVQRERFNQFFDRVVSEFIFNQGSVFYLPPIDGPFCDPEFEQHFLDLLGVEEKQPGFSNLNEDQFELCFNEILQNAELYTAGRSGATVTASYVIQSWKISGSPLNTNSHLHIYYGAKSLVIPKFRFESIEEFNFIKNLMSDLKICELNPVHLKND
jgi:hypothetical protein